MAAAFPVQSSAAAPDTHLQLIHHLGRHADALLTVLDLLPIGVIILDRLNRPAIVNEYAREVFQPRGAACALMALMQHRLEPDLCRNPKAKLPRGLGASISRWMGNCGWLISVPRSCSPHPLSALVFALPAGPADDRPDDLAHVVFLSDPDREIAINRARLRELYGLTPAEARLAGLLAEGRVLKSAAAELGITLQTARTHLKRIFGKTGAANQAQLVRLLLNPLTQIGGALGLSAVLGLSSTLSPTAGTSIAREQILATPS
jgi:DNA-binding CsgD family transcriptional regulator